MPDRPFNVLFLCTGNSARSIIGEVILNKVGQGRFPGLQRGKSAQGQINPWTLELLRELGARHLRLAFEVMG